MIEFIKNLIKKHRDKNCAKGYHYFKYNYDNDNYILVSCLNCNFKDRYENLGE